MVIPNLYLVARKVVRPEEWIKFDFNKVQYHYYSEPVPGVYVTLPSKHTYLFALKTNGKQDSKNIFTRRLSLSDQPVENICTNLVPIIEYMVSQGSTPIPPRPFYQSKVSAPSSGSNSTPISRSMVEFDAMSKPTKPRERKVKEPEKSFTWLLPPIIRGKSTSITLTAHELGGYRRLRKPLLVKFHKLAQRWMFASEIKSRTVTTDMCADRYCFRPELQDCKKVVRRELFLLDDGFSWAVMASEICGVMIQRRSIRLAVDEVLYIVDEKTGGLRRQTVSEAWACKWNFLRREKEMVCTDDELDFMDVVDYLR